MFLAEVWLVLFNLYDSLFQRWLTQEVQSMWLSSQSDMCLTTEVNPVTSFMLITRGVLCRIMHQNPELFHFCYITTPNYNILDTTIQQAVLYLTCCKTMSQSMNISWKTFHSPASLPRHGCTPNLASWTRKALLKNAAKKLVTLEESQRLGNWHFYY